MIFSFGSFTASLLTMLIPAAAIALLWWSVLRRRDYYRRRFRGWRLAWETWGSASLISLVLLGAFYWYLFWRPFYTLTIQPDTTWTVTYALPMRSVELAPSEIAALTVEEERLPPIIGPRVPRRYLVIQLHDGRTLFSAPTDRDEADQLLQRLGAYLP